MDIIGISGKKQHGKDTVADIIQRAASNLIVQKIGYADALYREVSEGLNVPVQMIIDNKEKFRTILQWWGTEFRRDMFDKDYWVRQLLESIKRSNADIFVVPDVRFLNEAQAIKSCGGILIRVTRPDLYNPTYIDTHPSETELDTFPYFDYRIKNHHLTELRQEVIEILKKLKIIE